ncbi:MAG: hypothetical protein WB643_07620 [Candidatus Bathyarchaeia archaeon]
MGTLESSFVALIGFIPLAVILLCMSGRENTTVKIWMGAWGAALALLTAFIITHNPALYLPTFIVGYAGLLFREVVIFQESKEGKMKSKPRYPAKIHRLIKSTMVRFVQVIPMVGAVLTLTSNEFTWPLVSYIIVVAFFLSLHEHFVLWKKK